MVHRFLNLAAELRIKIYRFTLVSGQGTYFRFGEKQATSAQLLRTCSQIYHEASEILYGENSFFLCLAPFTKNLENGHMLRCLPIARIKHIMFDNTWEIAHETLYRAVAEFPNLTTICLLGLIVWDSKKEIPTASIFNTMATCEFENISETYDPFHFQASTFKAFLDAHRDKTLRLIMRIDLEVYRGNTKFMCYRIDSDSNSEYGYDAKFVKRLHYPSPPSQLENEEDNDFENRIDQYEEDRFYWVNVHWDGEEYINEVEEKAGNTKREGGPTEGISNGR
ncbi:hypothetical protein EJ08DRAFT_682393 [Tothia fuscella]|uniref:Uncharacterized protein n=1 Tax=Tothia fuscella TaxID=1048955 RepID=A0A9P4NIE6_9PEZI|nr:hypothetical protein EJ08DRAFT_682393 [Tothia fuscella]